MEKVKSPCINLCAVSGITKVCMGCGRTLKQIAEWGKYSDEERERIMAELSEAQIVVGDRDLLAEWSDEYIDFIMKDLSD